MKIPLLHRKKSITSITLSEGKDLVWRNKLVKRVLLVWELERHRIHSKSNSGTIGVCDIRTA